MKSKKRQNLTSFGGKKVNLKKIKRESTRIWHLEISQMLKFECTYDYISFSVRLFYFVLLHLYNHIINISRSNIFRLDMQKNKKETSYNTKCKNLV